MEYWKWLFKFLLSLIWVKFLLLLISIDFNLFCFKMVFFEVRNLMINFLRFVGLYIIVVNFLLFIIIVSGNFVIYWFVVLNNFLFLYLIIGWFKDIFLFII